jgi:hypothetical protein
MDWMVWGCILSGSKDFSLLHDVQTGSGAKKIVLWSSNLQKPEVSQQRIIQFWDLLLLEYMCHAETAVCVLCSFLMMMSP